MDRGPHRDPESNSDKAETRNASQHRHKDQRTMKGERFEHIFTYEQRRPGRFGRNFLCRVSFLEAQREIIHPTNINDDGKSVYAH